MFDDVFGLVDLMISIDSSANLGSSGEPDIYLDHLPQEPPALPGPMLPDLTSLETQVPLPSLQPMSIEQDDTNIHQDISDSSQGAVALELDTKLDSAVTADSETVMAETRGLEPDSGASPDDTLDITPPTADTEETPSYAASQPFAAGDWAGDASTWHLQEAPNSCAIACQTDVLNSFGIEVSEGQIAELAQEQGWYDPRQGTNPRSLGYVLEAFGIPVTQSYDTSLVKLKDALDEGRKVVVALDANEIWEPQKDVWGNPLEQPDGGHAVWVTGIEESPAGDLEVILNDTGHEAGRGSRVAMHDFLNAWDDFGRHAAITDISPGGIHV